LTVRFVAVVPGHWSLLLLLPLLLALVAAIAAAVLFSRLLEVHAHPLVALQVLLHHRRLS
jgi:hypothetical protein